MTYGCVYCLIDPRTNTPFYVGQTITKIECRLARHLCSTMHGRETNLDKAKVIKELVEAGLRPLVVELDCADTKEELNEKEIKYIAEYKTRNDLVNKTGGGEFNPLVDLPPVLVKKIKEKLSISAKERHQKKTRD